MKVYITGSPGTGKTSVVQELHRRGVRAFGIDEVPGMCNWTDQATGEAAADYEPTKQWLQTHDWTCNVDALQRLLSETDLPTVVAGVASNQHAYLTLFDKVILLQCSEEIFMHRLTERHLGGGNTFGSKPEEQQYVLGWYKNFEHSVLEQGATVVDASGSLEHVVDTVLREINSEQK